MKPLSQVDLANALGVSKLTVSRVLKVFGRENHHLTDRDAIQCLAVGKIVSLGISHAAACKLLSEFSAEILYVHGKPDNQCWLIFTERENKSFWVSALTPRHLAALIDALKLPVVLSLHEIVADAQARLNQLKLQKCEQVAA